MAARPHDAPRRGATEHYIDRQTGDVVTEQLFGDRIVRWLYSDVREHAPSVFRAATGKRVSAALAWLNFDSPLAPLLVGNRGFLKRCGVDLRECFDPPESYTTPRALFERRIRYWDFRPLPVDKDCVASPADARVQVGSLSRDALLYIKRAAFDLETLVGTDRTDLHALFGQGDAAIFRLTPERYHYTHVPVAGRVVDTFELDGAYHACHPVAALEVATPISRNRRVVTVFDTDVPRGTQVGRVAMVEVVAMMIGRVEPRYSDHRYDAPRPLAVGDFAERGAVMSLFRPGSSTVVLLFEPHRVTFADDLVRNATRFDVAEQLRATRVERLETDVLVRSEIGWAR